MLEPSNKFSVRDDDACPLANWIMPRMVIESYEEDTGQSLCVVSACLSSRTNAATWCRMG